MLLRELRASLVVLLAFSLVTGIAYPFAVRGVGRTLLHSQANGSLVEKDGKILGSSLIGQNFKGDGYFHPRPSAAGDGYDAANSSGSNLAPTSSDYIKTVAAHVDDLRQNGDNRAIPVDLVTASGSGLDPDISIAAAQFQAARIAQARNLPLVKLDSLITGQTVAPLWGIVGEARINVLSINVALDQLQQQMPSQ